MKRDPKYQKILEKLNILQWHNKQDTRKTCLN